jgi:hypothetical protein
MTLQACNSEEDGLFAFDVHSDGSGLKYIKKICSLLLSYVIKRPLSLDVGI